MAVIPWRVGRVGRAGLGVALVATVGLWGGGAGAQPFPAAPSWASTDDQRVGGVAFGDVDGDGRLDLAAGTYAGGFPALSLYTAIFVNGSSGLQTTPSWLSTDERHTTAVGWGFVTGGAGPDLIAINGGASSHPSVIYPGSATGPATTPGWTSQDPVNTSGLDFALGDVNADGVPDLFVANQCYTPCTDIQNLGYLSSAGQLPEVPNWQSTNTGQFGGIALGDIDGGGVTIETYTVTAPGDAGLFWLPGAPLHGLHRILVDGDNPGKVTWDAESGYVLLSVVPAAGASVEFRYARSDELDLVVGARPGGVLVHNHGGAGPNVTADETLGPGAYDFKDLVFADMDLDGDLDLVAAGSQDTPLSVYENDQGTLAATASWTSTNVDYSAEDMVVVDFDGDGYPDVGAVEFASATVVRVHFNQAGTLEADPSFTIPWESMSTSAIGAGDVDNDGMPDLVVGRAGAPLHIYLNQGQPMAAPAISEVAPPQHTGPGSTTITITGSGFASPARAYLGDTELEDVVVVSDTSVTAMVDGATASGSYDVIVVNPDIQAAVLTDGFTMGGGDGGAGGTGAAGGTGGTGGSAGSGTAGSPAAEDDGGCDCRSARGRAADGAGWLGCLLLLAAWRFRRGWAHGSAVRAGAALGLCAVMVASCGTLIGVDDLVYDLGTSSGSGTGGQTGGQGGSAGTAGSGAGATGGGGTGGGTGGASCPAPAAPPLQVEGTVSDGNISVWVDDFFRLVFRRSEAWQVGTWNDLATDPTLDLAVQNDHGNVLCEPYETYQGQWWGVADALGATMVLTDESPARAIFDTTMDWPPSGSELEVHAVYTVWASGRVAGAYTLTNTGNSDQSLSSVEYNHYTVNRSLQWTHTTLASQHAFSFTRDDGAAPRPGLLLINLGPETPPLQDHAENVYWDHGGVGLSSGESVVRHGEFQLGPGGLDLATLDSRASDVLNPGLEVLQGGTPVGPGGYDPAQGAYVVSANTDTVDLRITSSQTRYAPAFVVQSFPYDMWSVVLDGEVLVRSDCLSGPHAHAHHDAQSDQLVFVYLGTIPTAAPDGQRTFEVRGQ